VSAYLAGHPNGVTVALFILAAIILTAIFTDRKD